MATTTRIEANGVWLTWHSKHRNKSAWHWFHGKDQLTYCGLRKPASADAESRMWDPLNGCRKCLERINREGY